MDERTLEIKEKGFNMTSRSYNEEYVPTNYDKISVGLKALTNVTSDINYYTKVNPRATKENVLTVIQRNDITQMRELSEFFFKTSGIYGRLCRYLANLYKYDWMVTPIIIEKAVPAKKILEGFSKSLNFLDEFKVKKNFAEIALKVVKLGVYYGYKVPTPTTMVLQELPVKYCRSRFFSNGRPMVEFNMKYFDDTFSDTALRLKILKSFPTEFQKGYIAYKEGKLPAEGAGDQPGWYMLDVNNTVKFNINPDDSPMIFSVIPAIIDLEEAKELDRKKMLQQLLNVIVQKLPLDKNGELLFDVDEAKALHNNAVAMLGQAIGVDVLTTFAEVDNINLADRGTTTSTIDEVSKVERSVFNEAGVSQMQFNSTGNLALNHSISNDESSLSVLINQFEIFLNDLLEPFNKNKKKLYYRVQLLFTTIYNYQALAKLYKEQMQIGFSKMLPQVALGQSQNTILSNAYFENEILDLNSLFVPPAMSSTMSPGKTPTTEKSTGRPELPDDEKSDKTIKNKEAMS